MYGECCFLVVATVKWLNAILIWSIFDCGVYFTTYTDKNAAWLHMYDVTLFACLMP